VVIINLIDIILVKSDPIMGTPSLRDQKIIRSLRKKYSIIGLGWNRQDISTPSSNHGSDVELFNVSATAGYEQHGTLRYILPMLMFWMWVFIKLCIYRPKIIHACNLDSFFPSYIYKILFRKKLVFDVFDRYAMAYIPKDRNIFFKVLYSFVNRLEEEFAKRSDVLINVSDELLKTYRKRPKICVTIMNCSEDMKNAPKMAWNDFRILFAGHIRPGRGLEILPQIVKDLKGTQLIITGRVEDRTLLKNIEGIPNIIYQGFIDHKALIELEANSNLMIALYDLNLQTQNEYVMGNKLFEAMMCGLPIITNVSQEIVNETNCGLVVEYENTEQIKEAIVTLRDNPQLRKRLGDNGRKAFLEKYNWSVMEERLYKIYESLLD
jgi:glycosyltransferase involved in cell wall biosynthesis